MRIRWEDAYRIRRIYRRLAKMRGRGHLRRLTVFVRHDNVVRLLEFLGVPSGGVAESLGDGQFVVPPSLIAALFVETDVPIHG